MSHILILSRKVLVILLCTPHNHILRKASLIMDSLVFCFYGQFFAFRFLLPSSVGFESILGSISAGVKASYKISVYLTSGRVTLLVSVFFEDPLKTSILSCNAWRTNAAVPLKQVVLGKQLALDWSKNGSERWHENQENGSENR